MPSHSGVVGLSDMWDGRVWYLVFLKGLWKPDSCGD